MHLSNLAIAAVALLALLCGSRQRWQGTVHRLGTAAVLALCAFACTGDHHQASVLPDAVQAPSDQGSVRTLDDGDTLLLSDQLGSLLAEVNANGSAKGRFAAYPFGAACYDSAKQTRKFANSVRDGGIGLDLMGARVYAPDLGLWTSGDPVLVNAPERVASSEFATANPYAYANLNPVAAADEDGHFWHLIAGAVIGAVIGGGVEAARQYMATGKIESWGRVGAAAAGGGISGLMTAACPAAGLGGTMAVGAGSGAAAGVTERLVASGGQSAGTLKEVVVDATVGAASAGLAKGAGAIVRTAARRIPPKAAAAVEKTAESSSAARKPPNPYGRLGKPSTRAQNAEIANELEAEGYKITGGGSKLPEEYIPGPGGGRKGSAWVDVTATRADDTVRVQTVDTLKSGIPTGREMTNAGKILKAHRDDGLFLVPK